MIHLFKYASYEIKNSKELIKKTNEVEYKYIQFKKSLDAKKEKLFVSDFSRWET
jgi:hypothetical protein